MKRTMTLNFKNIKYCASDGLKQIIKNRRKLILTVLSVFGIWCGTRIYISHCKAVSDLFSPCLTMLANRELIKMFAILITINLLPILISFLNGFFVFGMPASMISPCISGIHIGLVNAWIFSGYRLNGVFFSLLTVIPFAVAVMIMLLISCNESIILSKNLARSVIFSVTGERGELKEFFIRHLVIISLTVLITGLQLLAMVSLYEKLLV